MTLQWNHVDDHKWIAGDHTIIWGPGLGYVHIYRDQKTPHFIALNDAKAWAETFPRGATTTHTELKDILGLLATLRLRQQVTDPGLTTLNTAHKRLRAVIDRQDNLTFHAAAMLEAINFAREQGEEIPEWLDQAEDNLIEAIEGRTQALALTDLGPLMVSLEGGLVSDVHTADRRLHGVEVIVIDYDTEGADDDETVIVRRTDCEPETQETSAVVHSDAICGTVIDVLDLQEKLDARDEERARQEGVQ